ncbi:MAG: hypothetical protein LM563_03760 [Thermofilum sp.]|nr:hypothetical protein [Thermofilum sp.]
MGRRIPVSESLLRRLLEQAGLENRKLKLGRWVIKKRIGEAVGRESESKSQVEG